MARPQIPLLERLFDEVNRLAAAAGGEGINTPALEWILQIEKAINLLLGAADWGADAHAGFDENVKQSKKILGLPAEAGSKRESGSEGGGDEKEVVVKAVRGQKDRQALLREALMILKEARSLLRTFPTREK
jgi:hypothetical protein